MIFKNDKRQVIGRMDDKGIFRKEVSKSRHLLKVMNAWGIDMGVVNQIASSCKEIRIREKESGTIYSCSFATFKEKGVIRNFVGEQMFLPLKYFTAEEKA